MSKKSTPRPEMDPTFVVPGHTSRLPFLVPSADQDDIHGLDSGLQSSAQHVVEIFLKLEALSILKRIEIAEDSSLEYMLCTMKTYLHQIGYLRPSPTDSKNWTIDLSFGELSILSMITVLEYRKEPQNNLLVKDIFYGGEILDLHLYRFSASQNVHTEYTWDPKRLAWRAENLHNDKYTTLDAKLAVQEDILYTPFSFSFSVLRPSLSMTSMKLSYLRFINERLRIPVTESGVISAVVFVTVGELRMAVVKRYTWGGRHTRGCGVIVDLTQDVCVVRDGGMGEERILRYKPNRMIWIQEE
ncbi:hypothetical protein AA313_de0203431 [Arthrobotrys entomopaga]|nr:hypothetical protein AA313_de0203431 [Arthrobotrys entomopaga]